MSQSDKLLEALEKKIVSHIRQAACIIDARNHDDAKPGEPCRSCIIGIVSNAMLRLGLSPQEGMRIGTLMKDSQMLASGEWGSDREPTMAEYATLRTMMVVDELRNLILSIARDKGIDLDEMKTDGPGEDFQKIQYGVVAAVLFGLVDTSEEVAERVIPEFVKLEARERADEDLQNRRN